MEQVPVVQIDDCWNRIGVWSSNNRTCEKLKIHTHCVNCDVFHQAGKQLLSRPVELLDPKDILQTTVNKSKKITNKSYTFFRIGVEWFAISTADVITVINPTSACKIPHMSNTIIEGIGYHQGCSMLVVNLDSYILTTHVRASSKNEYIRFLLVQSSLGKIAIRVNELWGTQRCSEQRLSDANVPGSQKQQSIVSHRITYDNGQASLISTDSLNQLIEQQF